MPKTPPKPYAMAFFERQATEPFLIMQFETAPVVPRKKELIIVSQGGATAEVHYVEYVYGDPDQAGVLCTVLVHLR